MLSKTSSSILTSSQGVDMSVSYSSAQFTVLNETESVIGSSVWENSSSVSSNDSTMLVQNASSVHISSNVVVPRPQQGSDSKLFYVVIFFLSFAKS